MTHSNSMSPTFGVGATAGLHMGKGDTAGLCVGEGAACCYYAGGTHECGEWGVGSGTALGHKVGGR